MSSVRGAPGCRRVCSARRGRRIIAAGRTGDAFTTPQGVAVYAGLAPEMFAGDASALRAFQAAFKDGRFEPAAFQNRKDYFARRNVTAIVLEVPSEMIGQGNLHSWATVSLVGHAPEVQVSRGDCRLSPTCLCRT